MAAVAVIIFACVLVSWIYFTKFNLRKRWPWLRSWQHRRLGFLWKEMSFVPMYLASTFCRILCKNMTAPSDVPQSTEPVPAIASNNATSSRIDDFVPSLGEPDLKELVSLINDCSSEPSWQMLMERSSTTLNYQAWCRDPPVGPTIYRTRTVFKNVTPELIRDFFWDDDFRTKWDKMLVYFKTLHVCPDTGTMVVHWIRKLPVIFSEREYVIIRRIWESGSNYYCVTKGILYPSLPKSSTRKRVELYYSSWLIKPVKSRNDRHVPATEVLLFHYEDIGIRKEIVKMGARAGSWSFMKRMDAAIQDYSLAQANRAAPSNYVLLAQITTKIEPPPTTENPCLEIGYVDEEQEGRKKRRRRRRRNRLRWLVVGGIIVVSGITLKSSNPQFGLLSEAAKFLQRVFRTRKHRDGGGEREESDPMVR